MLPRVPGATPKYQTEGQDDSGFQDFQDRVTPVGAYRKTSLQPSSGRSANFWVGMDEIAAPAQTAAPLRKLSRNHDEQPVVGSHSPVTVAGGSRSKRHSAPPGSLDHLSFEHYGKRQQQRPSQSTYWVFESVKSNAV